MTKYNFGNVNRDDADFFGRGQELIEYYFDEGDLETIREALKVCEDNLGNLFEKLAKINYNVNPHNIEELKKTGLYPGLNEKKMDWCKKYKLGRDIEAEIMLKGACSFSAINLSKFSS